MVTSAYDQAAVKSFYHKNNNLLGKYDYVRTLWEEEIIRINTWPFLEKLLARKNKGLRILDLGCGSGDGYELFFGSTKDPAGGEYQRKLNGDLLEEYTGVDINASLLDMGSRLFEGSENIRFMRADFLEELPVRQEPSYDLYLGNFGTFSHCSDEQLIKLFADIGRHGHDGSLIIGDWLGCYAYEWQNYWPTGEELFEDYTLPYTLSYLREANEKNQLEFEVFSLRLMHPRVLDELLCEASRQSGVNFKVLIAFDRSIMVGRHLETGDYFSYPHPLRTQINSLLAPGRCTDLTQLLCFYQPRNGFDTLNIWYANLAEAWNGLVMLTENLLAGKKVEICFKQINSSLGAEKGMLLCNLMKKNKNLGLENFRANIMEPQLAYVLRSIENYSQKALGAGHGLTVVVEVSKS